MKILKILGLHKKDSKPVCDNTSEKKEIVTVDRIHPKAVKMEPVAYADDILGRHFYGKGCGPGTSF